MLCHSLFEFVLACLPTKIKKTTMPANQTTQKLIPEKPTRHTPKKILFVYFSFSQKNFRKQPLAFQKDSYCSPEHPTFFLFRHYTHPNERLPTSPQRPVPALRRRRHHRRVPQRLPPTCLVLRLALRPSHRPRGDPAALWGVLLPPSTHSQPQLQHH